jgi:hypothetical protein
MKIETTWKSTPLGEKKQKTQHLSPFCTIQPPCSSLVLSFFLFYIFASLSFFCFLLPSHSFAILNHTMTSHSVVYAVHKFEAENQDELNFHVGEAIVVLEKDEKYMDGWWQVSQF